MWLPIPSLVGSNRTLSDHQDVTEICAQQADGCTAWKLIMFMRMFISGFVK